MPYIVTTTKRLGTDDGREVRYTTGRRAVATLEEARQHVTRERFRDALIADNYDALRQQFDALRESGGTVGPLPDGTVIEVERVMWQYVIDASGLNGWEPCARPDGDWQREALDAYNTRHES